MKNEPKVMLGMSFFDRNWEQASETAGAFSEALWQGNQVVLGVEVDGLSRDAPEVRGFIKERLPEAWGERRVYVWSSRSDQEFFQAWPSHEPMPFFDGFSYGGAVNRMLALASCAGCQYLVRIDPGTRPPYYFRQMVQYHIGLLESGADSQVVSGQYTDRIALRDDFVLRDKKEAYHEFILHQTAIDPKKQITGGAGFTVNVTDGPPAISFPGYTPIWGSDDGLFGTLCDGRALVLSESRVLRTDPGQAARDGHEYPVRLACMVVLRQLLTGSAETEALSAGLEFLDQLKQLGFYDRYDPAEAKVELETRAPNIVSGFRNYQELRSRWSELIAKVARVADEHCQCVVET